LLISYANQLLEKRNKLEAAELYRKAKRNTEAAKILSSIADDLTERDVIWILFGVNNHVKCVVSKKIRLIH